MSWTLITGASAGFGWATAELLAEQGHNLWLVARRKDRLEKLAQRLQKKATPATKKSSGKALTKRESAAKVKISVVDLGSEASVAKFVKDNAADLKQVDILVNNAGLARGRAPLQEGAMADWRTMIEVNLLGLLRMTQAVLPHMTAKKRGHIVNIGSVAGRWAYPGGNVYSATKSAVHMLSESLRIDLNGLGIRVSEINPGMAETEFSKVRFNDEKLAKKVYEGMTPLNARDIAEAVLWCLNRPAHVNIQEIVIYPTDQASPSLVHRRT